jgi:hypothetical protein
MAGYRDITVVVSVGGYLNQQEAADLVRNVLAVNPSVERVRELVDETHTLYERSADTVEPV